MLIHRLLIEGDPAYEQEIFFTTRRGTRLLNMSDFRDTSRSNSWDYSAFVRTYALYLDEKLEFRNIMQSKKKKNNNNNNNNVSCAYSSSSYNEEYQADDQDVVQADNVSVASSKNTPLRDLKIDQILAKMHHLQQLLERFLATRPTGAAKHNRMIIVALYCAMKESFQIYYDITDILSILIDRFMELEIPDCIKVYEIFYRISKQFDELDAYYSWGKEIGVARSSEYPEVERITPKKLDLMDEFIRDKAANAQHKLAIMGSEEERVDTASEEDQKEPTTTTFEEEDMNSIRALPPPEGFQEEEPKNQNQEPESKEADLLHLGDDHAPFDGDKVALALFDGAMGTQSNPPPPPAWEAFEGSSDWETTLVQSSSYLPHQKATLGGGFDMMLLDGMYQQGVTNSSLVANQVGGSGSASSVALGSVGNPHLLALPAPPSSSSSKVESTGNVDPFTASLGVAPPPYVQMSDIEKKQRLLVEEQMLWQQYKRDGMQGQVALSKIQGWPSNGYGYGYGY